eukprot:1842217-Heterocapsa_arctica.AAC.1
MVMVDPWVAHIIFRAGAGSIAAALEVKETLRTQPTANQVVFLPIFVSGHWALLTVTKDIH